MLHPTKFLQTHQHRGCAIATVVDVNADIIETDVLVGRDPFDKRMAFVLHHPSSTKLYTGVWPLHAAPLCLVHENLLSLRRFGAGQFIQPFRAPYQKQRSSPLLRRGKQCRMRAILHKAP
jgi:hypothetical protein